MRAFAPILTMNFYPRPRVEGDSGFANDLDDIQDFYPRPRVEGDSMVIQVCLTAATDFYPRPRVEGD